MKKLFALIIAVSISLSMTACGEKEDDIFGPSISECPHQWLNATCVKPTTCSLCGETVGEPLGHYWLDATCTDAKTCVICGATDGVANGHVWSDATCEEPSKCAVCGEETGEALGHSWVDATYDKPKTCSRCGKTSGEPIERPTKKQPSVPAKSPEKRCLICNRLVKRSDTNYCDSHDCAYSGCPYPAKHVTGGWGHFCAFHSCSDPKCVRDRYSGSQWCVGHQPQ